MHSGLCIRCRDRIAIGIIKPGAGTKITAYESITSCSRPKLPIAFRNPASTRHHAEKRIPPTTRRFGVCLMIGDLETVRVSAVTTREVFLRLIARTLSSPLRLIPSSGRRWRPFQVRRALVGRLRVLTRPSPLLVAHRGRATSNPRSTPPSHCHR